MTTLGEVLSTAVLAGLRAESRRTVRLVSECRTAGGQLAGLGKTERAILERLRPERSVRVRARSLAPRGLPDSTPRSDRWRRRRAYRRARSTARVLPPACDTRRCGGSRGPRRAKSRRQLQSRAEAQWLALERVVGAGQSGLRTG